MLQQTIYIGTDSKEQFDQGPYSFSFRQHNIIFCSQMGLGLTLKMPRKPVFENVVCLCHLLNILANFFCELFLHTGKQCGP